MSKRKMKTSKLYYAFGIGFENSYIHDSTYHIEYNVMPLLAETACHSSRIPAADFFESL